jgi:hypothetical protein
MSIVAHIPGVNEIETSSGRYVDTHSPQADTITLEDIAHALSMTCRYGGHCHRFYSVAEHAVAVSRRVERKGVTEPEILLDALHHDDAEAYLGDIPRPMKPLLGEAYEVLSDRMDAAVTKALGLRGNFHVARIKDADNWILFVEARALLTSKGRGWIQGSQNARAWEIENLPSRIVTPDYFYGGVSPQEALTQFLDRHYALIERRAT